MIQKLTLILLLMSVMYSWGFSQTNPPIRHRARYYGIEPGILQTGHWNAITDVPGVKVGQVTLIEGDSVRTCVTVIIPHDGNMFQEKVPAAVYVGNGFGKITGTTQIDELGNIETPIALTNTLNVPIVANAMIDYMLHYQGNENVQSVNTVVGETNDGYLNDIRGMHVRAEDVGESVANGIFRTCGRR